MADVARPGCVVQVVGFTGTTDELSVLIRDEAAKGKVRFRKPEWNIFRLLVRETGVYCTSAPQCVPKESICRVAFEATRIIWRAPPWSPYLLGKSQSLVFGANVPPMVLPDHAPSESIADVRIVFATNSEFLIQVGLQQVVCPPDTATIVVVARGVELQAAGFRGRGMAEPHAIMMNYYVLMQSIPAQYTTIWLPITPNFNDCSLTYLSKEYDNITSSTRLLPCDETVKQTMKLYAQQTTSNLYFCVPNGKTKIRLVECLEGDSSLINAVFPVEIKKKHALFLFTNGSIPNFNNKRVCGGLVGARWHIVQ